MGKQSEHSEAIMETMTALYNARLISKEQYEKFLTLYNSSDDLSAFPQPCVPLKPEEIRQLRNREGLTRADFALYLNTTTSQIEQWESGIAKPSDPEQKLLHLIRTKGIKELA